MSKFNNRDGKQVIAFQKPKRVRRSGKTVSPSPEFELNEWGEIDKKAFLLPSSKPYKKLWRHPFVILTLVLSLVLPFFLSFIHLFEKKPSVNKERHNKNSIVRAHSKTLKDIEH